MIRKANDLFRLNLIAILIAAITSAIILSSCGTSSNSSSNSPSSTGSGSLSGTVTDSSGAPIEGATVVAGSSSPTALTDQDGKFTLSNIPAGTVTLNTITPGYETNSINVDITENVTKNIAAPIELPDVDDVANAPQITNTSVNVNLTGTTVSVQTTIDAGVEGDSIIDARAELVGYGVGGRLLTANGSTYFAQISIPRTFVGPSALIEVFAIDAKRRVGTAAATVLVPNASGTGDFSESTLNGISWGGSAEFFRAAFGNGDRDGDRRLSNLNVSFSGSTVNGNFADITMEDYFSPSSWAVTTTAFTGTLSLIDAHLGIYEISASFHPTGMPTRTVNLTAIGRLNSASGPTDFFGYMEAVIADTSPLSVTTVVWGRVHLIRGLSWSTTDLDGDWVWSEFIKLCPTCAANFAYNNPFQYNSSFTSSSGTISSGQDTLGNTLATSSAFSVTDASLGIFSGTLTSSDGSTVTISGLIGPMKKHVFGLFNTSLAGNTAYGPLWGNLIPTPPHFATSDFGQKYWNGSTGTAIWRGFYVVTGGPDQGTACYVSLWTKPDGGVAGGVIKSLPLLPACIFNSVTLNQGSRALTFNSGSLAFTNTTDGQIDGSATDGTTTFTLAPASSRNASMGVEKERLVGDFSLDVTNGPDTGYFFMNRTFIE